VNVEQAEAALARAQDELDTAKQVAEACDRHRAYWDRLANNAFINVLHAERMVAERERVLREARVFALGGWHPEPTEQEGE